MRIKEILSTLLFFIIIFISQNSKIGGNEVNSQNKFEKSNKSVVITMGSYGGYVLPDYAFLDRIPNLVIFKNGYFIKRVDESENSISVWKEGYMEVEELKNLIQKINNLGFWKFNNKVIQKEISKRPLITDLPTTVITVALKGRKKVFECYGLSVYSREIKSLEKPMKVYNLLKSLEPQQLYYPERIEIFIMELKEYLFYRYTDIKDNDIIHWPFETFQVEKISKGGYQTQIDGKEVIAMVELLSKHKYFEFKNKQYLIRYRPYFNFLRQKEK